MTRLRHSCLDDAEGQISGDVLTFHAIGRDCDKREARRCSQHLDLIIHCCCSLSLGGLQACPKLGSRTCSSLVDLTLGGKQRQGCRLAKMLSTSLILLLHLIAEFQIRSQTLHCTDWVSLCYFQDSVSLSMNFLHSIDADETPATTWMLSLQPQSGWSEVLSLKALWNRSSYWVWFFLCMWTCACVGMSSCVYRNIHVKERHVEVRG